MKTDVVVRKCPANSLQDGWTVTVTRGTWSATCTGPSSDSCFDTCMEAYEMNEWPDKDRHGGMN